MRRLTLLAALAALAAPAAAHDFWLDPSSFSPAAGEPLAVGLRVGDHLDGEPVPRRSDHLKRFVARGPEGEIGVDGELGAEPAGSFIPDRPGLWLLGYESHANRHRLPAERFERYLAEEGLETVVAERARAGESAREGRELYYRSAKAIVAVGEDGLDHDGESREAAWSSTLGLPLELVPEGDLRGGALGEPIAFRLLLRGEPLAGALVTARPEAMPSLAPSARTDASGRVALRLPAPGRWLVKSVHMERAPDGVEADWLSWWASLTFERSGE